MLQAFVEQQLLAKADSKNRTGKSLDVITQASNAVHCGTKRTDARNDQLARASEIGLNAACKS
jgi:hypothetical protein